MSEKQFVDGLYPKPKHSNAPDFVIGKLSINMEQFMPWVRQWCKDNPEQKWINIDMTQQKNNPEKGSASLDTWKPKESTPVAQAGDSLDVPF